MKALVSVLLAAFLGTALAQDYPSKPVRLVIPFGPGSLADAVPRLIQPALEEKLGQRIVIDHRPGAGGNVGAHAVLDSPADGYTLMMAATNNLVINQYVFRDMRFDPLQDFLPISLIVEVPLILQVNPSLPAQTLKEFIAHARANPGKLNYSSPSTGTLPHLAMEILSRTAGLQLVHVPFKGGAPATNALLANDVQAMLIGYATTAGHVRAEKVRPLAVASGKRLAALPAVPTFGEAGFPELEAAVPGNWWGMVAPRGTPAPVVQRWAAEIRAALADPATQKKYQDLGLTPVGSTPGEFAAALPDQAKKWEAVLRAMGTLAR
ncbi:MAG TPA: tripartite tricarboxylate transporter substrate binding protein [Burkholderiales bacterium]|nr:tripartite tricarboxylate transporter substrate binding protein [Burkholderiales bacterium]